MQLSVTHKLGGGDITKYFNDGTLSDRIAGSNGFEEFDDIYLGDYIIMPQTITAVGSTMTGTSKVKIAGFNMQWGNYTYSKFNALTMIPDTHFGNGMMNDTNTTEGGYMSCKLRDRQIGDFNDESASSGKIAQQLKYIFKDHMVDIVENLTNGTTSGYVNRTGNVTTGGSNGNTIDAFTLAVLLSEIEVYGSVIFGSSGYDSRSGKHQLPLFALSVKEICTEYHYWLRDVASTSSFCAVHSDYGWTSQNNSTDVMFIRPRFTIK